MTRLELDATEQPRRRASDFEPEGMRIGWSVLVQVVAWISFALLTYGAINARVSVVEDRVNSLRTDITEMKADVKTLLMLRRQP